MHKAMTRFKPARFFNPHSIYSLYGLPGLKRVIAFYIFKMTMIFWHTNG